MLQEVKDGLGKGLYDLFGAGDSPFQSIGVTDFPPDTRFDSFRVNTSRLGRHCSTATTFYVHKGAYEQLLDVIEPTVDGDLIAPHDILTSRYFGTMKCRSTRGLFRNEIVVRSPIDYGTTKDVIVTTTMTHSREFEQELRFPLIKKIEDFVAAHRLSELVRNVLMIAVDRFPADGSFPPSFYLEVATKTPLVDWITRMIATHMSDKFWILISVPSTARAKLANFREYYQDRHYTNQYTNGLPAPYLYEGYVYFMWNTSGLNLDQVNSFTHHLQTRGYTYAFIAGNVDATGSWNFVHGRMVSDAAVGRYANRMPLPTW